MTTEETPDITKLNKLAEIFARRLAEHRGVLVSCSEEELPEKILAVLAQYGIQKLLHNSSARTLKLIKQISEAKPAPALNKVKQNSPTKKTSSSTKPEESKDDTREGEGSSCQYIEFNQPMEEMKAIVFSADAGFEDVAHGLAHTGSLVITTSAEYPRSISLVPSIHLAWLRQADLLSDFNALAKHWQGKKFPSNFILVSGPSKTADIELTLVHGIHGPRKLIVFLTT